VTTSSLLTSSARCSSPFGLLLSTIILSLYFVAHSVICQAGRLVIDKEKLCQESQNNYELTEVDLDNLEPIEDPNMYDTKPSNSKVATAKVSISVDSESGVGTEDITDYDASLSSDTFTILHMETRNSGEGSWSGK
jgi:hypothetical protein